MFGKLAVKNVTRSLKDYSVYFLTLTFGVCIFYIFNSLESQWCMQALGQSASYLVDAILIFMDIFSAFVSVVLACLVLYANTFLMKRRKRELGTYFLLGLPTGRVSLLLVLETLLIGLLALAAGLGLGILLSHVLGLFTIAMFSAYPAELGLILSVPAIGKTAVYFGAIFLVVMACTGFSVSRARLIDLMQGRRKNEEMKERPLWQSVLTFLLGGGLLLTAYAMLLTRGLLRIDPLFFLMLALGTAGTLLFFRSLSGFLLRLVKGRKRLYYKGLNLFVLRQFNSRIHTTYVSMTVICLLLLLAIGVTACSVGLNHTIEANTDASAPYDFTLQNYSGDVREVDIPALLTANGFDTSRELRSSYLCSLRYGTPRLEEAGDPGTALALSDYNALMALQGREGLTEEEVPCLREDPLVTGFSGIGTYRVVSDQEAQGLPVRRQLFVGNYAGDAQAAEARLEAVLAQPGFFESGSYNLGSRLQIYLENMGTKLLVLFMGLYLGLVFLLTAAAVLALQQLSQAADDQPRYQLLSRLGAQEGMRDRAVFTQVFLAFALPLALAVVHAAVGMTAANAVIAQVGRVDAAASSAVTAAFLLVIYGAYFLATYLGSRRMARGRG